MQGNFRIIQSSINCLFERIRPFLFRMKYFEVEYVISERNQNLVFQI